MNHSPAMNRRRNALLAQERRGVLLLMILSLLVLFVLIGMTFILTASQFKRAATMRARGDLNGDSPQQLSEMAVHQLLRDSSGPGSAIWGHGLFNDVYGTDGLKGIVDTAVPMLQGQMLELTSANRTVGGNTIINPTPITLGIDYNLNGVDDLIDAALTLGPDANNNLIDDTKETKPTGFYNGGILTFVSGNASGISTRIMEYANNAGVITIRVETDAELAALVPSITANDRYVINGRPFNGTGVGYNRTTGNLDLPFTASSFDFVALHPNHSMMGTTSIANAIGAWNGGMDEPYDVADYQNMALAWVPANFNRQRSGQIIPSFHRPSLINYWQNFSGDGTYPDAASLRPKLENHPNFGNPYFNPVTGPWDVDNDANGVADSIWVDMGVPPQLNAQGRMVKPMFAILCVDGEGRVNVSTAGTLAQSADDGVTPRGDGYGPAEIRLSKVATNAELLIRSRHQGYAETAATAAPGLVGINDDWVNFPYKNYLQATSYVADSTPLPDAANYLNPIDPVGVGAFGINPLGQPIVTGLSVLGAANAYVDDPYECNIVSPNSSDNLFGAADMESQLRRYDSDSLDVSQRLNIGSDSGLGIIDPGLITTASFEISAPQFQLPTDLRRNFGAQHSFIDIVSARFRTDQSAAGYLEQIKTMYPYELLQGQKMNLNRPVGFTADNDGNGVVDEPGELGATTNRLDLLNDRGFPDPEFVTAPVRQLFARNLYCLARTLVDRAAEIDYDGDGIGTVPETSYALAQWAVNIIDFRDADSIMTPFEFDINIADGWQVDGNIGTHDPTAEPTRGIVWGCERPELLITETLAWHDRRTVDASTDGTVSADTDEELDQQVRPSGSFFIELHNPWSSQVDRKPRELYAPDPNTGKLAVNLGRLSQKGNADGASPVWRLMVSDQFYDRGNAITHPPSYHNPDHASYTDQGQPDRMIYFFDKDRLTRRLKLGAEVFSISPRGRAGMVRPGGYAVIGSAGKEDSTTPGRFVSNCSTSNIGADPDSGVNEKRHIVLVPGEQAFDPFHEPVKGGTAPDVPVAPFGTVIIDSPKSLSISEGYGGDYDDFDAEAAAVAAVDMPLDKTVDAPLQGYDDGNHAAFRVVHLQRLADPTLPYNVLTNPYRTIDSSYVDLNVFNSTSREVDAVAGDIKGRDNFHAHQRGDGWNVSDSANWHLLYRMEPRSKDTIVGPDDNTTLRTTLGRINTKYDVNNPANLVAGVPPYFPHLTWNNRNYNSEYELLNVPRTSSFHLPRQFGIFANVDRETGQRANFPHLFDLRTKYSAPESNQSIQGGGVGLDRILEYVDVPSRYLGTEKWYSNDVFSSAAGIAEADARRLGAHSLSRFREPGKINLNTITDGLVWEALAAGTPNMYGLAGTPDSTYWSEFIEKSIRVPGYSTATLGSHLNSAFPTQFPRPFRPTSASDLGPLPNMREATTPNGTSLGLSGLLRESPAGRPLFTTSVADPTQEANRSSYFHHRGIQRLANMTTFQSNVYAVWVTVGYFEVEPAGVVNEVYPDGYRLGAESGSDTGNVERHRSFYMIDRSIPVAFEPGKNHNVDKAITLKRHLD